MAVLPEKDGGVPQTLGHPVRMDERIKMRQAIPGFRCGVLPILAGVAGVLIVAAAWGCSNAPIVEVDGSSTVFPITEAMAEEFQKEPGEFRATVGVSGTGGGFKKFCNGEIDIVDASRPIKPVEMDSCADNDVDFIELPVAYDGLSVIAHPDNDWVDSLTLEELRRIWSPSSSVDKWSDVRPGWPEEDMRLVGADTASGTFDYFTEVIVGEEGASRADYVASADDNVLVRAVAGEKFSLGYLGFAYYVENADRLKLVPVNPGSGPVAPSKESIAGGSYVPLSRPLFIYVDIEAARRPEVREFVNFYLSSENRVFISEVGYVGFSDEIYELVRRRFELGITGSAFRGEGSSVGVSIEDILKGE